MPLYWPQPWLLYVKPTKSNLTLLCNLQYIGETKHRLKDRSVTPKPQFQNTFSAIATLFPICYLSQLIYLDMNYRASGNEQTWRTIIIMYNLYLFFGLLFFAATPYHIIPCNFRLLFYSSIYIFCIFVVFPNKPDEDWYRPFAWWRHFTTMTRILQGFAFLFKLRLLLFKPHWGYQG